VINVDTAPHPARPVVVTDFHPCPYRVHHTQWANMIKWLDETPGGYYLWSVPKVYFEREEDMILFQLTWC